jgi:hypothetical protein
MDNLPFKENTEYEIILSKLKLDEERKKWVTAYPSNAFVRKLIKNYSQARGCMMKMEARLEMTGRLEECDQQFQAIYLTGTFSDVLWLRRHKHMMDPSITSAWWRRSIQAHPQPPR